MLSIGRRGEGGVDGVELGNNTVRDEISAKMNIRSRHSGDGEMRFSAVPGMHTSLIILVSVRCVHVYVRKGCTMAGDEREQTYKQGFRIDVN